MSPVWGGVTANTGTADRPSPSSPSNQTNRPSACKQPTSGYSDQEMLSPSLPFFYFGYTMTTVILTGGIPLTWGNTMQYQTVADCQEPFKSITFSLRMYLIINSV